MTPQPRRGWSPVPDRPDDQPWYRQFWPWFLIAFPALSVVAGISTIIISLQDPDGLVVDDYYKAGLAINERLGRRERAESMALSGQLGLDGITGDVVLQLSAREELGAGTLRLRFHHATRSDRDVALTLEAVGPDRYVGALAQRLPPGNWDVDLSPPGDAWRINGRLFVPMDLPPSLEGALEP